MASRQETFQRKQALRCDLLQAHRDGTLASGGLALSYRELSVRYGLSKDTIATELRKLEREGVLQVVPNVGTFGGNARSMQERTFLFTLPYPLAYSVHLTLTHRAFEAEIAAQGGSCLTLSHEDVRALAQSGALPELSGVFNFEPPSSDIEENRDAALPRVVYNGNTLLPRRGCDEFDFDHRDGGQKAARHLLSRGHRRIAFLGLHTLKGGHGDSGYEWSRLRAIGWREALREAGIDAQLEFLPSRLQPHAGQMAPIKRALQEGLRALLPALKQGKIEAVVAVNQFAAHELFAALKKGVPHALYPAVIAFDGDNERDAHLVSSLRLPWDELGAQSARRLCDRASGRAMGPSQTILIPMQMMSRLTCRSEWSRHGDVAALLTANNSHAPSFKEAIMR